MKALVMAALIAGQVMPGPGDIEHRKGFCAGYAAALENIAHNRDNYRSLLKVPAETPAHVLHRKYHEKPAKIAPMGAAFVDQLIGMIADGIDLYVIPPPVKCGADGSMTNDIPPGGW